MNILLIAAHPDDEVMGMGATIKKLGKKNRIFLCIVSEGATAQYDNKKMIQVRRDACIRSSKLLGISNVNFLDFPDMQLDTIPHLEINRELEKIIKNFNPNTHVILISGHANIEMAVKSLKSGAFEFIQKPFSSERLLNFINRAIENIDLKKEKRLEARI